MLTTANQIFDWHVGFMSNWTNQSKRNETGKNTGSRIYGNYNQRIPEKQNILFYVVEIQ